MAPKNISTLLPPGLNNTLENMKNPKAFGSQLVKDETKQYVKSSISVVVGYKEDVVLIVKKLVALEINHVQNLAIITKKLADGADKKTEYTEIDFNFDLKNENESYVREKAILNKSKKDLEKKIEDFLKDPYIKVKKGAIKVKTAIKKAKSFNLKDQSKKFKTLSIKVLKNASKSIVPVITLQGTKLLINVVYNINNVHRLVDKTNEIIENAYTKKDIADAIVVRNSTIAILDDTLRKLNNLKNLIKTINSIVSILNIILKIAPILLKIIIPPIDFVTPIKEKFRKKYEEALKLVDGLNAILSSFQRILDLKIQEVEDLKKQLEDINDFLESVVEADLEFEKLEDAVDDWLTDNKSEEGGGGDNKSNTSNSESLNDNLIQSIINNAQSLSNDGKSFVGDNSNISSLTSEELDELLSDGNPYGGNNKLYGETYDGDEDKLDESSNIIDNFNTQSNPSTIKEYKGFKFVLKDEVTLGAQVAKVVKGNIRRKYAVAIDRDGVEVLKSSYSFTLDPQDLVEQLKLIIDLQNLKP